MSHFLNTVIDAAIGFFTRKALDSVTKRNTLPARIEQSRYVNGELMQRESGGNQEFLKAQITLSAKQLELMQQAEKRNEVALQLQTEIAKRGLELQAKQLEDNRQLGRMYLQTLEKQTQIEFQQRQQELQAQYDGRNWAAVFSRAELQKIFSKSSSLLMVVSKPNVSAGLFPDLAISLGNKLNIFIGQYFPENDELCPVQFYSDFFDRAVSKAQLTQLQTELPTPTASIYTDITSKEVFFNVRLQGIDEPLTETLQAWNWRDFKKQLMEKEGCSEEEALEEVEEVIIKVHKVLAGFLGDWYYLNVNPHHLPRLLSPEIEKEGLPSQWLLPCVQALVGTKKRMLELLADKQAREAAEKARKEREAFEQRQREKAEVERREQERLARERREKEERERLEREKGTALTFSTMKGGRQETVTVYEKVLEVRGTQIVMVYIPAGEFEMGSNEYDSEKPIHRVKIEKAYYMGKYPVTQRQWEAVMGNNPSYFRGENLPVEKVSWNECIEFCERLSSQTNKVFRLPTEAEWEYACRGGTKSKYWWGYEMDDNRCWHDGNSGSRTHAVDEKVNEHTNGFGLCDMLGNVWEWTHSDHEAYGSGSEAVLSKKTNKNKLLCGGSWYSNSDYARSASRYFFSPSDENVSIGFRLVLISP